MTHELKIRVNYADAIVRGDKTFEVRLNDRGYQTGDLVKFTVIDDDGKHVDNHFLEKLTYKITYILSGFGILDNYVVFSIQQVRSDE